MPVQSKNTIFRFGPFELNPAEQELRRNGVRLRLPASRFRLLLLFMSRHGQLVTREEIASALWSDVRTIDTNSGIHTAVNQLREQLEDDSSAPKYIETVVGVGYRFIATVLEAPDAPPAPTQGSGGPDEVKAALSGPQQPIAGRSKVGGKTRSRIAILIALAAIVIAAVVCAFVIVRLRRTAPAAEMQLVRVTDTGDVKFAAISPDGKYVALVRENSGQESLWVKQLLTGQMLELVSLGTDVCPGVDFSPDSAYLYFVRMEPAKADGELDELPLLGGTSRRVVRGISGVPAISPDGRNVAFVRSTRISHGQDSIVVAKLDDGDERVLASFNPPGIHFNRITWTADGQHLVFPLASVLFVMPVSGGQPVAIPGPPWTEIDDVWRLPASDRIAVAGQRLQDATDQVLEISLATGQVQAITHDLAAYSSLRTSREGRALLAVQNLTLSSVQVIAPGKQSEPRVLSASHLNHDGIAGLAWTPDSKIVYTSEPGSRQVLETNRDGSGSRRLALTNLQAFSDPVISPRGDFIAVVRWAINDSANIWRMNLDGSEQKRLTEGRQDFSPSISPDGQWIVYAGVEGGSSSVMKVPAGGGAPVRVTNLCADNPAISPDGKWIACTVVSDPADRPKLAILPFSGSAPDKLLQLPDKLLQLPAAVELPPLVWTPDNRSISFIETVDGVSNIWRQPVDGGPAVPVTHFTSGRIFNFRWSNDGWLALARGTETADAVLIRDSRDGH